MLTLIMVLGLVGPLEASDLKHDLKHLQKESLALQQQELTLAQTYRQLMHQRHGLLDQLTKHNQKTKHSDWQDLFNSYHQVNVGNAKVQQDLTAYNQSVSQDNWNTYQNDLNQLTSDQNGYQNQLQSLTPKHDNVQAFQNEVTAVLTALEANQQQLDANAQAWAAYRQEVQELNAEKKAYNTAHGKK
jgi:chromosome segregation ATPase